MCDPLRRLANLIKREYPDYKITVRRIPLAVFGRWRHIKGNHFGISIKRGATIDEQIDSLMHESAHVVNQYWPEQGKQQHTRSWGIEHAKIYALYEEHLTEIFEGYERC